MNAQQANYHTRPRPKVLLVDDRQENLIALEHLLADMDLDLYSATNGNDALRLTLHHDFALALLDIQMPGMDGYELASILRSEEKTARLPFIFLSAIYKDHVNIFKGYESGAFSYITKPFQPEVLINKIRFFVEKYEQEQILKDTHRLLELRVKERTAELERSNADLEHFAYIASHDLQEPLRMVSSYVQLLQRRYKDRLDQDASDYIEYAVDGAERMKALISDLLAYSRVARAETTSDVDMTAVLAAVRNHLRTKIADTGALITSDPLPVIKAESTGMLQVLQNLVANAIKFKRAGITPQVHIAVVEEPTRWTFSVRDNGIGIEPQYAEQIFVIFKQLHPKNTFGGTGIGLAVARKVVERLGGRIWFESTYGEGSTFHFRLPK